MRTKSSDNSASIPPLLEWGYISSRTKGHPKKFHSVQHAVSKTLSIRLTLGFARNTLWHLRIVYCLKFRDC